MEFLRPTLVKIELICQKVSHDKAHWGHRGDLASCGVLDRMAGGWRCVLDMDKVHLTLEVLWCISMLSNVNCRRYDNNKQAGESRLFCFLIELIKADEDQIWCWNWNILGYVLYHCCRCPGSLHHQDIRNHVIGGFSRVLAFHEEWFQLAVASTHLTLVPHICVSESGHHWFR